MKQFTHISIQQVHYSGSVENTVAFYDEAARQLAIANAAPQLVEALQALLQRHVELVSCGDCGNWDVEQELAVIAARAALAAAGVTK